MPRVSASGQRLLDLAGRVVPRSAAKLGAAALLSMIISSPALADQTPLLRISSVDSLHPLGKFVGLHGYANAACDGNRLLLEDADVEYRKQMLAIVLGAYFASKPVVMVFTVSGGNCRVSRVITYDQ